MEPLNLLILIYQSKNTSGYFSGITINNRTQIKNEEQEKP